MFRQENVFLVYVSSYVLLTSKLSIIH